ncbi:MAG: hypothetical protein V4548_01575 [Bacteroidota bacterium]
MKIKEVNIEERKPIWIALSNFYLDTELEDNNFKYIALNIIDSPYSLKEVKCINKYEVFPVLNGNLLSVAGEWSGFDEELLIKNILLSIKKRNIIIQLFIEFFYLMFKWMFKDYWIKTENTYNHLRSS